MRRVRSGLTLCRSVAVGLLPAALSSEVGRRIGASRQSADAGLVSDCSISLCRAASRDCRNDKISVNTVASTPIIPQYSTSDHTCQLAGNQSSRSTIAVPQIHNASTTALLAVRPDSIPPLQRSLRIEVHDHVHRDDTSQAGDQQIRTRNIGVSKPSQQKHCAYWH